MPPKKPVVVAPVETPLPAVSVTVTATELGTVVLLLRAAEVGVVAPALEFLNLYTDIGTLCSGTTTSAHLSDRTRCLAPSRGLVNGWFG